MSYIKLNGNTVDIADVKVFTNINDLSKIEVQLQSAPIKEVGVNGCQIDDVIMLVIKILESFNGKVPHEKTVQAIGYLQAACSCLDERTKDRIVRKVEGTEEK
jgi:hypothetical protein